MDDKKLKAVPLNKIKIYGSVLEQIYTSGKDVLISVSVGHFK